MADTQRVVVVRHGETEWSRAQRHTGRTDVPLTERGREQATQLHAALSAWTFAAVFSSPLIRATETCALAGFAAGAIATTDLLEWDYGDYEGMTTTAIRSTRPGWRLFRDGVVGGETLSGVSARADSLIRRFAGIAGNVLVFGHGHVLRVLTARWLEMPPQAGERFVLRAAGIGVLGHEHDWTALSAWDLEVQ